MNIKNIPGRAFLDTCVVNFMLDNGEQIHDGIAIPDNISSRAASDISAFKSIFVTGQRALWQLAISPYTYEEVINTRDSVRLHYLNNWFLDIWQYWQNIVEQNNDLPSPNETERMRADLLASGVLGVLPDIEDRLLIIDAVVYRCDCFCTRDWRTVLKYRNELSSIPLRIITPTEWWKLIKPYASLWA